MSAPAEKSEFRFTGRHMFACMVLFFGVIIAVNFTMASFASRSWTGLVVKNSYVASQQFNGELDRARTQKALRWTSTIAYENGELSFVLKDNKREVLMPDAVNVIIGRPAFEQQDQQLNLNHLGNGIYSTAVDLDGGLWALRIEARAKNSDFRRDARILVGNEGVGTLQ